MARVKNKWKCILKDGMIHVNGKDYLFAKCTGYVSSTRTSGVALTLVQRIRVVVDGSLERTLQRLLIICLSLPSRFSYMPMPHLFYAPSCPVLHLCSSYLKSLFHKPCRSSHSAQWLHVPVYTLTRYNTQS